MENVLSFDMSSYYGVKHRLTRSNDKKTNTSPSDGRNYYEKQNSYGLELFDSNTSMKQIVQKIEKDIEKFTENALEGRERRSHQLDKLVSLGAIPQKNPKAPFRILKGMREKQKEKLKKKKEMARESGMLTPIMKKSKAS